MPMYPLCKYYKCVTRNNLREYLIPNIHNLVKFATLNCYIYTKNRMQMAYYNPQCSVLILYTQKFFVYGLIVVLFGLVQMSWLHFYRTTFCTFLIGSHNNVSNLL